MELKKRRILFSVLHNRTNRKRTTPEPDNGQALKANRRNRIAIYVSLTLSVIGIAVLFGVVLGKVILDIII